MNRVSLRTIQHLTATRTSTLLATLSELARLPESMATELIEFGSVYVDPCTSEKMRSGDQVKVPHGKVRLQRISNPNYTVSKGSYIRFHPSPRQYPEFDHVNWEASIVYNHPLFVVLNKPSGVPCHSTSDNLLQNAQNGVSTTLGMPVYTATRLDAATSGLLVLSKDTDFTRILNTALAGPKACKYYKALVCILPGSEPLSPGLLVDWTGPDRRAPRQFASSPSDSEHGWKECRLEVLSVRWISPREGCEVTLKPFCFSSCNYKLQEVEVRLLTGRTHQIRGQMALHGFPVLGDSMYWDRQGKVARNWVQLQGMRWNVNKLALAANHLAFNVPSDMYPLSNPSFTLDDSQLWWDNLIEESYQ